MDKTTGGRDSEMWIFDILYCTWKYNNLLSQPQDSNRA